MVRDELVDAGAGTAMGVVWLAVIPGFLPAAALTAVLVLPLVAVGLAAAVPPYAISRLAMHGGGKRRRPQERVARLRRGAS